MYGYEANIPHNLDQLIVKIVLLLIVVQMDLMCLLKTIWFLDAKCISHRHLFRSY